MLCMRQETHSRLDKSQNFTHIIGTTANLQSTIRQSPRCHQRGEGMANREPCAKHTLTDSRQTPPNPKFTTAE